MFSPANTSKKLSTYDDKGLYFRNAPSDILQGQVLADTIIDDGFVQHLHPGAERRLRNRPRGRPPGRSRERWRDGRRHEDLRPEGRRLQRRGSGSQGLRSGRHRPHRLRRVVEDPGPHGGAGTSTWPPCTEWTATWATPLPTTSRPAADPADERGRGRALRVRPLSRAGVRAIRSDRAAASLRPPLRAFASVPRYSSMTLGSFSSSWPVPE